MNRFEYKYIEIKEKEIENTLNELGNDGWDLFEIILFPYLNNEIGGSKDRLHKKFVLKKVIE